MLKVSCGEGGGNLDVTSNHLDVIPFDYNMVADSGDTGDEISKRAENFGRPVGQGPSHAASSMNTAPAKFSSYTR